MKRRTVALTILGWLFFAIGNAATPKSQNGDRFFASDRIVIPVVSRTPGAEGSFWKTDVFITNTWRTGNASVVLVQFFTTDGLEKELTVSVAPLQTVTLRDIVFESFGLEQAVGLLLVQAADDANRIAARADIYNTGGAAGTFGQSAPGISISRLNRNSVLPGLSVGSGRVNVGLANPNDSTVLANVRLFDDSGLVAEGSLVVEPFSVVQSNSVLSWLGTPRGPSASILITADRPLYTYASVIELGSGAPVFVTGVGDDSELEDQELVPPCEAPAPLSNQVDPAPGYIVMLELGLPIIPEVDRLTAKYYFRPIHVYRSPPGGFAAYLTPEVVAALRCEPTVKFIEENAYGYTSKEQ